MPTPRPVLTAIISIWTGMTRDTAVKASALYRATKMPSTTLYSACTSMLTMMGTDTLGTSRLMGMAPSILDRS